MTAHRPDDSWPRVTIPPTKPIDERRSANCATGPQMPTSRMSWGTGTETASRTEMKIPLVCQIPARGTAFTLSTPFAAGTF
eukprot:6841479-Pyramimonas_sp.AAC.1